MGDTSGDTRIREAQLVASGVLADLPCDIATPTLAIAFAGSRQQPTGAALLMRDVRRTSYVSHITRRRGRSQRMRSRWWIGWRECMRAIGMILASTIPRWD